MTTNQRGGLFIIAIIAVILGSLGPLWAEVGDEHLALGNPSHATTDIANATNYLLRHVEYALAYNVSNATPNWVSWHLNAQWLGPIKRKDHFIADPDLPAQWPHVDTGCYDKTGFTRGHMCNSEDRTDTQEHNDHTFYMSNMVPQCERNNEQTWKNFETFCRKFAQASNDVYIVAGPIGKGGTGTMGRKTTLPIVQKHAIIGQITVPASTWKVVLVLPPGATNPTAVTTNATAMAVLMPNRETIDTDWKEYITTINSVEKLTGYTFFSEIDPHVAVVLKATKYKPSATTNFGP